MIYDNLTDEELEELFEDYIAEFCSDLYSSEY